jgi:hypothetical protein
MRRQPQQFPKRQRGAVAIIMGIVILVLIGFIGLVLDLGHLYNRKVELQNAADAAALAGARELNGTSAGVTAAAAQAIALAAANGSDFGATPVEIDDAQIELGPHPDGPWVSIGAAAAAPTDKFFIKVDTSGIPQGTRPTWFMHVVSAAFADTSTFGRAVAGRRMCENTPMFTCTLGGGPPNYGYVKGQSYLMTDSPAGTPIGPGNIGWMDPVLPGAPSLINGVGNPEDGMKAIICRGLTYCISPGIYSSLTQSAFNPMMNALNTRFNDYSPPNIAEQKISCPSDTNVKEYTPAVASDWLETPPASQVDVHWSGVRPLTGDTPAFSGGYPGSGSGVAGKFAGTPYGQTSGDYFEAPTGNAVQKAGRRIITIGLADNCLTGEITGAGKPVNIVAFARFLLQAKGQGTGANKGFYGEFIETVSVPPAALQEIMLYR